MRPPSAAIVMLGLALIVPCATRAAPLVAHEWGTVTTVHAPDGTPQGRLNRISPSEVLPPFVHRFEPAPTRRDPRNSFSKTTFTPGRPDVTMRLETPVIYFYPPMGPTPTFDIDVKLRGGILGEFYPKADASVEIDFERIGSKMQAGVIKTWDGAVLKDYIAGSLRWRRISLSKSASLPRTDSSVWLAPRRVASSSVVTSSGERERYLFYRGVANLAALVQTRLSSDAVRLRAPKQLHWLTQPSMTITSLWLDDIKADGTAAFRQRDQIVMAADAPSAELGEIPLCSSADYSAERLAELRRSMKRSLLASGLFEDEAEAMLETWKDSYYRKPGLRIFYVVPPEWATYFLPLRISVPNQLTRVLVGRIDLMRE